MGYARNKFKTEHNGAKHGKGAWCTKKDAKLTSNTHRRSIDRLLARGEYDNDYNWDYTA